MQASFSSAFLRGDPAVGRFLPADFRDPAARGLVIRRAAGRPLPVAPALLAELRAQNPDAATNPARREHLDALATPGTVVVVSGQQVGLFLGPLYTFYKAASAISLARALAAESGARCVPIFWLQTEDHDYEEIRSCRVAVPGAAPLRLALPADAVPARCSIAHRVLGAEITELHAALDAALSTLPGLPALPHRAEVLDLFRRHYRPGATLAAAFAGALSEIFTDEGLLVLSPRCAAVAGLARPVLEQALVYHHDLGQRLLERGLALRAAGLCEQVPARPDATLFFFHSEVTGPRYRLERGGGCADFTNPDPSAPADQRVLSEAGLRAILGAEPLRFSTSALLRPLVQDTLLPTVAYVGGPGEINYFAQLSPLYELLGVAMPLVVPRGRFRLIPARARSLLAQLGLGAAAIEAPVAEVVRRALRARPAGPEGTDGPVLPDPAALRKELLADVGQRLDALLALEPGLEAAVKRTRVSVSRNIDKLLARYDRLRTERDRTLIERIERAQALLFPDGAPQERVDSVIGHACQLGLGALKDKVFSRLGPDELYAPAVRDLEL
ncbi:MAG: bacillithiol biosynthesis cysteine-adding enzyme BshC [Polyangia bacterium]